MEKEAKKTDDEKMTDNDKRVKKIREEKTDRAARTLQKYVSFLVVIQVYIQNIVAVPKDSNQRREGKHQKSCNENLGDKKNSTSRSNPSKNGRTATNSEIWSISSHSSSRIAQGKTKVSNGVAG